MTPCPLPGRILSIALVLAAGMIAGCVPPVEPPCQSDETCPAALVCARDHTCANPAELMSVTITWRVLGQPATEATCADLDIAELAIEFRDTSFGEDLTYRPFRCSLGQVFFNRMPRRFGLVALTAFNSFGQVIASPFSLLQESETTVELDLF